MTDHAEALAKALEPFSTYTPDRVFESKARFALTETTEAGGGWFGAEDFRTARSALAAYRSRPAAEVVMTEEMVREIWDHATNATCQTLQDKGMCNCPDSDCVAATVEPDMANLAYHCNATLATPALAGTEPAGEVVERTRQAAIDGWNACRRQVYALAENTIETVSPGPDAQFASGRYDEAKRFSKAFCAFEAEGCSEMARVFAALRDQSEA